MRPEYRLDEADKSLLNVIQAEFPLTAEPFADLARRLGTGADEVMGHIAGLKESGIIRMIGPVIESRSLGFQSTLVAMKVADANLEKAAEVINSHSGVSHGYEREHYFNVWFTLALPPGRDIEKELETIAESAGAEIAFSLPAVKMYKIGAYFDVGGNGHNAPPAHRKNGLSSRIELSSIDRRVINEMQQDLALSPAPFSMMAQKVGLETEQFLGVCRSLVERGIVRRYSASINHRNAGFTANAMSCWTATADRASAVGEKLAALKEVSHCYERKTNPQWSYNIFAMIHGRSREQCREIAETAAHETGLTDYVMLYSTKEFKKTRVKYLV